ncbi:MAG: carboxypeptidase-like regulatory domain-containing protein [Terriglobales bacterium]
MALQFKSGFIVFAFITVGWTLPGWGQTAPQAPASGQLSSETLPGSIRGTVVDQSGALIDGALVKLSREDQTVNHQTVKKEVPSGNDGQFSLANVAPGPFELTVTSAGFATQTFSGVLEAGEIKTVAIVLGVAEAITEVQVRLSQTQVAEEEIKLEEKQRVLGVLPNFYVSYIPNAAPLDAKQKFKLALRTVVDPFTFVFVGAAAGVEQAEDAFSGYGQGSQGYAKRLGAGIADMVSGTFLAGAVFPALLKQDPRYFYKGVGSKRSRILYAIANAVICKGDNGRWQPNYSNILGSLAAGGISNSYYPKSNRGAALTFETTAIGIGGTAVANLFQEFVFKKFTRNIPNALTDYGGAKP